MPTPPLFFFFFFNDTATTEIYTLSLHDALPIWRAFTSDWASFGERKMSACLSESKTRRKIGDTDWGDRKSTRLNSSHGYISYAVFCLKKKKTKKITLNCMSSKRTVREDTTTRAH